MLEDKKFNIGSKTSEQFFSEFTNEAIAEHMICGLDTGLSKEEIEEMLTYLEDKE